MNFWAGIGIFLLLMTALHNMERNKEHGPAWKFWAWGAVCLVALFVGFYLVEVG